MRITNNVLVNNLKRNLYTNLRSLDRLQTQLSTGKRINKPSDDPTGIVDTLRLSTRIKESQQYQANVKDAISGLESTDDALNSLNNIMNRIYELTVYAANGTLSHEDRGALAEETSQLIVEVENLANTAHGDRYLFGGTNTLQTPYEDGVWNSNNDSIEYEIGVNLKVSVNITAQEVFRYDDPSKDLMLTLKDILDHMNSDDISSLGNGDLSRVKDNIDQVLSARAQVGARVNRLELAADRLLEQEINFTNLQSEVEGVDPAKVILDMKNQENVYQASLSVGARVIQPTLVDFLS